MNQLANNHTLGNRSDDHSERFTGEAGRDGATCRCCSSCLPCWPLRGLALFPIRPTRPRSVLNSRTQRRPQPTHTYTRTGYYKTPPPKPTAHHSRAFPIRSAKGQGVPHITNGLQASGDRSGGHTFYIILTLGLIVQIINKHDLIRRTT